MTDEVKEQANKSIFLPPDYLKPYLDSFIKKLSDSGYTELSVQSYYSSVAHFVSWLHKNDISLENISYAVILNFNKHSCYCSSHHRIIKFSRGYLNKIRRFIDYLGEQGIIVKESTPQKTPPLYLGKFRESLQGRGLAIQTIKHYENALYTLVSKLGDAPEKYNAKCIRQMICDAAKNNSRSAVKKLTTVLRAYLRFLSLKGVCRVDLDLAVPTIAEWKLSAIPKYIEADEIDRVVASCNITTNQGLRDRAIILLLSCLGLRAGDIFNMQIEDINWEEATLCVNGKGRRENLLPLPQEVGDALLAYLEKARPQVSINKIFLCLNAPYRPFSTSSGISSIVSAALYRAGIANPPSRGASLLRHSAATRMLRNGATLETVLTVLRHKSLDMTGYYAKVDFQQLMRIAQPWPEGAPC